MAIPRAPADYSALLWYTPGQKDSQRYTPPTGRPVDSTYTLGRPHRGDLP